MGNPGFSDRILSTLECSPRPPRAAVHSWTPVERTTNLIQYLHLQKIAMADARTWLKHENAAKRCKTHVTQCDPRSPSDGLRVARPLAHAPSAPQRASQRRLATSPSPRLDPQPPRRRRRRLSCAPRGHQVRPALPVPRSHRRRAAPDSNMIEDELRQLGLVARRRSASSWLDCRHEGGGTTRSELGVCTRQQVLTGIARVPRSGGDRGSRLRGFESVAHLHASVGAQRPRGRPFGVAQHF
jgi:hypothetical protein